MCNEKQVNWFRLLVDLKNKRITSYDVAERLDVSHTTVQRWGQGSEPRHRDGEKFIDLWCRETGNSRGDLPMIYIYAAA